MKNFFLWLFFLYGFISLGQEAQLQGVILDENNVPVVGANISTPTNGTQSNINGFYTLTLPANKITTVKFSYLGLAPMQVQFKLKAGETKEFNPVLKTDVEQIGSVVITGVSRNKIEGITSIEPETIRRIPGANAGVENLLKTLPGVSSNNELSTQYAVRGGNYDENLVYVNGIEVYRPFLIRSGQQEGLSFVNTDLVRNVNFSAGGFQAKYGDKLSSVLDITYRRPTNFGASLDLSMLGASASVEGITKNKKLTAILGLRYRNNSLFVNSKETEVDFNPIFADAQTYLTYQFSKKFSLSFLGNISLNEYRYEPKFKETKFGTIQEAQALQVFYEGQEEDRYTTYLAALKADYQLNANFETSFIGSIYNTQEQEYFDILAEYRLGQPNTNIGSDDLGEVEFTEGVGGQLTHARNDLDALIVNFQHKGKITIENSEISYGLKYTHENIRDRIQEYEIIDSAGYSIRPPLEGFENNQPYEAFEAPLAPYYSIRAYNETQINRIQAFAQYSYKTKIKEADFWLNAGLRSHYWQVEGKGIDKQAYNVISPRAQIALKPNWEKDMLFRLSGGFYYQPPFYRELRGETGAVNPKVKAQQAIHIVAGNDYSFKLGKRPFKLITEAYYKNLNDVNPYTLENVRIRYAAQNNAKAYAYGADLRLNGEFVLGTESWVSVGYLKTEENIENRGYISRPTDQRLKFAILFQDYVPNIPKLKLYLNMVYNTGLPGGVPNYADPYVYQVRLDNYHRVDAGFSYVLVDSSKKEKEEGPNWLKSFKDLSIGFEIFNIFDRQNSITNTYVRDVYSKRLYSVPNYLTPRVFNLRMSMRF